MQNILSLFDSTITANNTESGKYRGISIDGSVIVEALSSRLSRHGASLRQLLHLSIPCVNPHPPYLSRRNLDIRSSTCRRIFAISVPAGRSGGQIYSDENATLTCLFYATFRAAYREKVCPVSARPRRTDPTYPFVWPPRRRLNHALQRVACIKAYQERCVLSQLRLSLCPSVGLSHCCPVSMSKRMYTLFWRSTVIWNNGAAYTNICYVNYHWDPA